MTPYTTADGLPSSHVTALAEDRIRRTLGLARRRGSRSCAAMPVSTPLPEQAVRALHVDRADTVWAGTREGLVRFVNGRLAGSLEGEPLSDADVLSLFEDREGNLWIGTRAGGLNRLQNRASCSMDGAKGCHGWLLDGLSGPRGADLGRHVRWRTFQFANNKFVRYTAQKDHLGSNLITSLAGSGAEVWVGTDGGGVSVLRNGRSRRHPGGGPALAQRARNRCGNRGRPVDRDRWRAGPVRAGQPLGIMRTEDGLSSSAIQVLHLDIRGALWVGTNGGGITVARRQGHAPHSRRSGAVERFRHVVPRDRNGAMWVGTYGGGLNRLRGGTCAM